MTYKQNKDMCKVISGLWVCRQSQVLSDSCNKHDILVWVTRVTRMFSSGIYT